MVLAVLLVVAAVVIVATSGESIVVRFLTSIVSIDIAVRLIVGSKRAAPRGADAHESVAVACLAGDADVVEHLGLVVVAVGEAERALDFTVSSDRYARMYGAPVAVGLVAARTVHHPFVVDRAVAPRDRQATTTSGPELGTERVGGPTAAEHRLVRSEAGSRAVAGTNRMQPLSTVESSIASQNVAVRVSGGGQYAMS